MGAHHLYASHFRTKIHLKRTILVKNILEKFARGNISPNLWSVMDNPDYERAANALIDCETRLLAAINDELTEIFEQHIAANAELSLITETERFIHGYRLGVLMTMEVFNGKD